MCYYVRKETKSRYSVSNLKKSDGSLTKTYKDKTGVLNEFFSSVFTQDDGSNIQTFNDKHFTSSLENIESDVQKLLRELDPSKSMGPDNVHPLLLKALSETLSVLLTMLFKISVESGQILNDWKDAHVTPLFKKDSKLATTDL